MRQFLGWFVLSMSVGSKNEDRSSPKQIEFFTLLLWVAWVLAEITKAQGNKYSLWLQKKQKQTSKQKCFPEGCWLACIFRGRNGRASKGARPLRTVSLALSWFAMSPFCICFYKDLVLLSRFFQVIVETAKSRLISVGLWDQKGKDCLSSLRVKKSWEETLTGWAEVMWSSFIEQS